MEIQRSLGPNFNFKNSIQTNGCLLSQEFIEFFAENDFHIGLSLDGPPEIHNIQRVSLNGKGSFNKVWEAKERIWSFNLRNKKKIHCAFIAVLTRNSLLHLDDFYNFFKENRLNVQISFLLLAGSAMDPKASNLHITPKEYGQAMIYLFDRWVKEPKYTFSIKPFSHILRSFVSGVHHSCMFAGCCYLDYLNIDPKGNIVPCGRWDKNQFCYGNINIDNFDDAFNSADLHRYKSERSKVVNSCKKCQHFDICHGGCAFSGYMRRRYLSDRDYYCTGHKMLFDHMKKIVKKEISFSD